MKVSDIPRVQRLTTQLEELRIAEQFEGVEIHVSIRKGDRRITLGPDIMDKLIPDTALRAKLAKSISALDAELAVLGATP